MKKIVLATAIAALSTAASAQYYVQGDIGLSKPEYKLVDEDIKLKGNDLGFRVAVGTDTGNVRYELDYTNYGKADYSGSGSESMNGISADYNETLEVKAQSIGLSAIYDFASMNNFTPYVGARVAWNKFTGDAMGDYKIYDSATNYIIESGSSKEEIVDTDEIGYGVLAGVQYTVSPKMAVNAGVEYNYLGEFTDAKANQYGAKVGLRYNF
ncbi:hypothetical protein B0681_03005 [Moraxella porci DSM 25326]|uniref:Porin opacity type domain-containing protein n=1 Tax=Moraxella porci DSM 25326 TaxID=573983 RepID=A0A1T0CUU3_9GAMM|nr:opacity family porin [Moraxella porci]OOS26124.1 hypothetical protein B0681_03005 [Moraxella porci DSM 25326]